jgi:prepilin-type N-terminal cleavage/methylation domain-containing protein
MKLEKGFTLIELSIVLVIIGFLLAAISSATQMIQASKVNRVSSDIELYSSAINNFRATYNYLPGDFPQFSSYFPGYTFPEETGNGNGDGIIRSNGSITSGLNNKRETYLTWFHLSVTKMVSNNFPIIPLDGLATNCPTHLPSSPFSKGCYWISTLTGPNGQNIVGITVGSRSGLNAGTGVMEGGSVDGIERFNAGVISSDIAYTIDRKFDDGIANTGRIFALRDTARPSNNAVCYNSSF